MTLAPELFIAIRYTLANMKQSLMIAFAVGLGVAIIIFIPSVNLSFFGYFLEKTVENSAHIKVTRELETMERNIQALTRHLTSGSPENDDPHIIFSDQTLTRKRNIKAYRQLMKQIRGVTGVLEVSPYINEQIIVSHGSQIRGGSIQGIVPEMEKNIRQLEEDIAVGNIDNMGSSDVFIGWRLADELGVRLGNRIQLVTSEGRKSYKVAGLINTGIYQKDLDTIYISLKSAQQLLNMSNEITGINIRLQDIYAAPKISDVIHQTFHLKTRNWMEDNEVILDQIGMFRVIIAFISFLIVFAAASSITSVLIMVVASKSKEIGILKAMGLPPGSIMRLFVFQAICLSILGATAGVFGGMGLIELYNATPYSKAESFLGIGRQPVEINLEYTYYAIIYAMLSSFLASLFPAWHASRLDPVKAINS